MHDDTDRDRAYSGDYSGAYDAAFGAALRAALRRVRLSAGGRRTVATLVAAFALVAGAVGMAGPAQAAGATLSGTVLGPGGAPAANLGILVFGSTTTVTDAAGHFTVPVTPGNGYFVCWGSDY